MIKDGVGDQTEVFDFRIKRNNSSQLDSCPKCDFILRKKKKSLKKVSFCLIASPLREKNRWVGPLSVIFFFWSKLP